jgi:ribosomal protein S18 acetylase RimI-like enzyme
MEIRHIRNASPADIETIAQFQVEMALETENLKLDLTVLRKGVKAVIDDESKGSYYACEVNGQIVASLLITYEWSDWRNALVYWLQSVYVVKEYRRQGIFNQMYEFIKSLVINDPGVAGIRLYVDKSNTRALNVYEKSGMNGNHYVTFEWMKTF